MERGGSLHGWEKTSKFCSFALQEYQAAPAKVKNWYEIEPLHTGSGTCSLKRRFKDNTSSSLSAQLPHPIPQVTKSWVPFRARVILQCEIL